MCLGRVVPATLAGWEGCMCDFIMHNFNTRLPGFHEPGSRFLAEWVGDQLNIINFAANGGQIRRRTTSPFMEPVSRSRVSLFEISHD